MSDELIIPWQAIELLKSYRQLALSAYAFADCIDGLIERRFRTLDTQAKEVGVPEITPLPEDELYCCINNPDK